MADSTQSDSAEQLFLLEVLVDNLFIKTDSSSPNLNKDLAANMADTCVLFKFLHYPPLAVCESDFIGTAASKKDTSNITYKTGKSCFFSLRAPSKGPIRPIPFPVNVSVIRKMKEGVLPDKLELGKTTIDLGESFMELLEHTDDNCDTTSLSKTKNGTFDIKDESGRKVGRLTAFVRLSCFGKMIVTHFSLTKEDEKSYLFKATKDLKSACKEGLGKTHPQAPTKKSYPQPTKSTPPSEPLYENSDWCKPVRPPREPLSPWEQSQIEHFDSRREPRGLIPQSNMQRDQNSDWCKPVRPPREPLSPWEQSQIEHFDSRREPRGLIPQSNMQRDQNSDWCKPVRPPREPLSPWEQSQIEHFDAPRSTRGPPEYLPQSSHMQRDLNSDWCVPVRPPREITRLSPWEQSQIEIFDPRLEPRGPPRYSPQQGDYMGVYPKPTRGEPPMPVTQWEQNQIDNYDPQIGASFKVRGERLCECPYPIPPGVMAKYAQKTERNMNLAPGEVGMQDDQVIFQLPLKKPGDPLSERDQQIDSQVYYKLTSAEETRDGVQKNTVNVKSDDIPGMATRAAVGPVSGLPVDDGHDVFLLKIGKKCEGDKKRNLELELRTPKMKEPKPPASDKDTQYLESDIPKTPKRSSQGKGKGNEKGKGKGKGKGAKKSKK